MGTGRDRAPGEGVKQWNPDAEGPGGNGSDPTSSPEGYGAGKRLLGHIVEQGRKFLPKVSGSSWTGSDQRQRPRRGAGGCQPHHQEAGGSSGGAQETGRQLNYGGGKDGQSPGDVTGDVAEINDVASTNTTGSANYEVKYDSNNLDTPDEFQAFENEDTIGLSRSGGEIEYNHFNFNAPDENEVFVNDIKKDATPGDLWSESPRARARAGMRRRRLANRSVAQKLRAEVVGLFEVMVACTLMAGSLTREIIEDPLWEAMGSIAAQTSCESTRSQDRLP